MIICFKKILKRKYHIRNFFFLTIIRSIDYFLCIFTGFRKKNNVNIKIKTIVISNIGHLGDNLLTSYFLEDIQSKYPKAKIDILTSTNSEVIYQENSLVRNVFKLDHWKLNRSFNNTIIKILKYLIQYVKIFIILRRLKYDLAIDFYAFYPNTVLLLNLIKCKLILSYKSSGFSELADLSLEWEDNINNNIVDFHYNLLNLINIKKTSKFSPNFKFKYENYLSKIPSNFLEIKKYVLIQPFSPNYKKEWYINEWINLIDMLVTKKINIIILGKGEREFVLSRQIISNIKIKSKKNVLNLVNKLTWNQYLSLLKDSKLLVGLDSFGVHIASFLGLKSISLNTGINPDQLWKPIKNNIQLRYHTECYPCEKGCDTMDCINKIKSKDVLNEILNISL